jgi:hypothetical protein
MKRLIPLLLGATLLSAGCSYRYVYGVEDTPIATESGQPSSIVNALEYKYYVLFAFVKDVYYECGNDGGKLDCVKLCDVKNEDGQKIKCRFLVGY